MHHFCTLVFGWMAMFQRLFLFMSIEWIKNSNFDLEVIPTVDMVLF